MDRLDEIIDEAVSSGYFPMNHWKRKDIKYSDFRWITFVNDERKLPYQGYKLHISARPSSAKQVLKNVIPVLSKELAAFKVVGRISDLINLLNGKCGISQIGKFITIYPYDDFHAVRLGIELDKF